MKITARYSFPAPLIYTWLFAVGIVNTVEGHGNTCELISELKELPECHDNPIGFPVYFPSPQDCGKYFTCENNIVRCFHCPEGRFWDQENKICNSPEKTNCTNLTTSVSKTKENPKIESRSPRDPPALTTEDPIGNPCPEGYDGLIKHPYDCRYFYNCRPGRQPCLFMCQEGLFFNPAVGYCDFPSNVPECIEPWCQEKRFYQVSIFQ